MRQVNVHQAKTQLSQLLAEAEAGEEVIIARAGKPAVRLVPVSRTDETPRRRPGLFKDEAEFEFDMDWWAAHKEQVAAAFNGMSVEEYRAEQERREDQPAAERR